MKFSCTQENLSHGIGIVSHVAARSGNLPILSNIQIQAGAEGIVLKATNLEVGVSCTVRGKTDSPGEFTVPAKLFAEFITFLPKETVTMELKEQEQELLVFCGAQKTRIKGAPAADFPLIPAVEGGARLRMSAAELLEGIEQVAFAVSPTETRPEISGALLSADKNTLTIAGTDSYRLAEKAIRVEPDDPKNAIKAIVPLRALQEIARICAQAQAKEESAAAQVTIAENQIALSLPAVEFVARLIEGNYPDYRAIVPAKFGTKTKLSRAELAATLKAAGLFSKTGVYDVGIEINPKQGEATVSATNAQTGEYRRILKTEAEGEETKIAFSWKFLLDGVNALKGEAVWLSASDAASPAMLTEDGNSGYFYLVMPIKE